MVYTIYLDVLFALNFMINYLLLFASARICAVQIHRGRIALSAALGALYGTVAFLGIFALHSMLVKTIVAVVMVIIAMGGRGRRNLRAVLVFVGLSFAFSGAMLAIHFLTRGAGGLLSVQNGAFYLKIPLGIMLVSAGACYIIFSLVFQRTATGVTAHEICEVEVYFMGRETRFFALVDSGNTLTDPLTNRPVIIVEYEAVREILPLTVRDVLEVCSADDMPLVLDRLPRSMRASVIPYKTLTNHAMLLGFIPDKIIIDGRVRKITLAICKSEISDGGAYHALVGIEK